MREPGDGGSLGGDGDEPKGDAASKDSGPENDQEAAHLDAGDTTDPTTDASPENDDCGLCQKSDGAGACTVAVGESCADCHRCNADGECVPAPAHEDCGLCEQCDSNGVCKDQPAGSDFKNECDWLKCESKLAGWSDDLQWCESYTDTDSFRNGTCNGAGACDTTETGCLGTTHEDGYRCDPGCAIPDACQPGSLKSTADGVDERCYVDGERHGCVAGLGCSTDGLCE